MHPLPLLNLTFIAVCSECKQVSSMSILSISKIIILDCDHATHYVLRPSIAAADPCPRYLAECC